MFVYRFDLRATLHGLAPLTVESVAPWLPSDAIIRSFVDTAQGHMVDIGLRTDRDSHEEALGEFNRAFAMVQQLGYAFAEGEITRVTDRAIEMATVWGLGGLGVGASAKNSEIAAIASAAGLLFGLFVGSRMENVEPIFQVQRTYFGWALTEVPKKAPGFRPAVEPG